MILSRLIKKGGLTGGMTVTPATLATQQVEYPIPVAPVATVAVADKPEPPPELSPYEEKKIRAWLGYIEEADPQIISEIMDKCRDDLEARRYFLKHSEEVPEPVTASYLTTCGDCTHFKRIDYPHLGHCAKSEPEAIGGLLDTDRR